MKFVQPFIRFIAESLEILNVVDAILDLHVERFLHTRLGDIIVMYPATIFFSDIVGRLVCCVGICLLNNITSNFLKWGGETMNTNVITPPLEDSQNLMSVDLMSLWRKNRNFQQVGSFRLRIGI